MERYVGHLANHFRLAPECLAVLDHSYHFLRAVGRQKWASFSDALLDELRVLLGLIKLPLVLLDAPRSPFAFMGDSSEASYALSVSAASPLDILAADRYSERARFQPREVRVEIEQPHALTAWAPGAFPLAVEEARLDELAAWDGPPAGSRSRRRRAVFRDEEVCGALPRLADEWISPYRWRRVVRGSWAHDAPIQELEARVLLLGLRRCARAASAHGCRLLSMGDNLSAIFSFVKGRSKSPALRALCARAGALTLACQIPWSLRYVETARNPTDYDSRCGNRGELLPGQTESAPAGFIDSFIDLGAWLAPPPVAPLRPGGWEPRPRTAASSDVTEKPAAAAAPCSRRAPRPTPAERPAQRSGVDRAARACVECFAGTSRLTSALVGEGLRCAPRSRSRGAPASTCSTPGSGPFWRGGSEAARSGTSTSGLRAPASRRLARQVLLRVPRLCWAAPASVSLGRSSSWPTATACSGRSRTRSVPRSGSTLGSRLCSPGAGWPPSGSTCALTERTS